jgi:hypothetical protein
MRDVYTNLSDWEDKAKSLSESYKGEQYWYDKFNEELDLAHEDIGSDKGVILL